MRYVLTDLCSSLKFSCDWLKFVDRTSIEDFWIVGICQLEAEFVAGLLKNIENI